MLSEHLPGRLLQRIADLDAAEASVVPVVEYPPRQVLAKRGVGLRWAPWVTCPEQPEFFCACPGCSRLDDGSSD